MSSWRPKADGVAVSVSYLDNVYDESMDNGIYRIPGAGNKARYFQIVEVEPVPEVPEAVGSLIRARATRNDNVLDYETGETFLLWIREGANGDRLWIDIAGDMIMWIQLDTNNGLEIVEVLYDAGESDRER